MRKGGGNWVEGDRFFDRKVKLNALKERVADGTHTLLTAQRRMGKTSLVRELLRQLAETGEFGTVFVDLEAANNPADMVAEIAAQAWKPQGVLQTVQTVFANIIEAAGERVEEMSIANLKVTFRAGINDGNWKQKGDEVFEILTAGDCQAVLAIDELPVLVNRMLKDGDEHVTPEGKRMVDELLSWLRKTGQLNKGRISMILSGSVGLEPILEQAGLSAHANIFSGYDLNPWSEKTSVSCLEELARSYGIDLSVEVRREMCRRLRCCIPHHVQMFFDKLHHHLENSCRTNASLKDVDAAYRYGMLSVRGQSDLKHYENRLEIVLGRAGNVIALDILTTTATCGILDEDTVGLYLAHFLDQDEDNGTSVPSVVNVLHVLEHDGYLERFGGGYRFVSGLLEDWWKNRYGRNFEPVFERQRRDRRPI